MTWRCRRKPWLRSRRRRCHSLKSSRIVGDVDVQPVNGNAVRAIRPDNAGGYAVTGVADRGSAGSIDGDAVWLRCFDQAEIGDVDCLPLDTSEVAKNVPAGIVGHGGGAGKAKDASITVTRGVKIYAAGINDGDIFESENPRSVSSSNRHGTEIIDRSAGNEIPAVGVYCLMTSPMRRFPR